MNVPDVTAIEKDKVAPIGLVQTTIELYGKAKIFSSVAHVIMYANVLARRQLVRLNVYRWRQWKIKEFLHSSTKNGLECWLDKKLCGWRQRHVIESKFVLFIKIRPGKIP